MGYRRSAICNRGSPICDQVFITSPAEFCYSAIVIAIVKEGRMVGQNSIRIRLIYTFLAIVAITGTIGPGALLGAGAVPPIYMPIVRSAHITDGLAIVFV